MQDFELLRNVTIGQYIPTGSIIHRLDPRTKIIAAICLILAISFNTSIVANLIFLAVVMSIAALSRIPQHYILRGLRLGLPILILVFSMQFLIQGIGQPTGQVYFTWRWFHIGRDGLHLISVSILRISSFIFLTSLVTMTSTTTELTHGVELLLEPLRPLRVPAHELALIMTIALRFVPTLAEELERIMKAQASRGGEFGQRRIWRPDRIARAYLPLIVPLFLGAFRRAEDLVLAMEARCYVGGAGRTKYVVLQAHPLDYGVAVASVLFMVWMWFYAFPPIRTLLAPLGMTGL